MEETIDLKELFFLLKKRISLIIILTAIGVLVSGVLSFFVMTPIYQSSTQILVTQSQAETATYTTQDVQTSVQLVNTYSVIIKSPAVLDEVSKELGDGMTSSQLSGKISVSSEENSQVFTLSVEDEDPERAALIANEVASSFQEKVVDVMKVDNVSILSKAEVIENQSPIKPQPLLNIAIGLVVGLMLGIGLAFLLEYLDNTVKTEQDIEKYLEIPVLGSIANMDKFEISQNRNRER